MAGTTGLLLAAGAGRRAGGPKALRQDPDGRPWVVRTASVLLLGGCDRVVVVIGAAGGQVDAALCDVPGVSTVGCARWAEGMGRSLRAGLEAVAPDDPDVVVVTLVDLPDVGADVVARLLAATSGGSSLARATYDGVPGHPVLVGRDHLRSLAAGLGGDMGGQDYLRQHGTVGVECGDLATGRDVDGPPAAVPIATGGR